MIFASRLRAEERMNRVPPAVRLCDRETDNEVLENPRRVFVFCNEAPGRQVSARRYEARKLLLTALLGIGVGIGSLQAQAVIRVGPPRPLVEVRGIRPSPAHVWVGGYHRWDGNAYAWNAGRWEAPPRPHAVWAATRYRLTAAGAKPALV